jgi:DNA repair exonuclease SbcCD ATPase subunit
VEEDPEKLLREYSDRQKTKITRLEAQLAELKKVAAERDQYRARSEALAKELEGAKRHLEAASKQDAVIKDLQAKVDASLLAHSMLTDENGKLKAKAQELAALARKLEEKSGAAEKGLADATKSLAAQTEGRKDAEARISVALQVLQGEGPAKKPSPAGTAHPEAKPAAHPPAPHRK